MIVFSLTPTAHTSLSHEELGQEALQSVITALQDQGFNVGDEGCISSRDASGSFTEYPVEPGPAMLRYELNADDANAVRLILKGEKFGRTGDPVLWMRVVTLGVRLHATYAVTPSVHDPDYTDSA